MILSNRMSVRIADLYFDEAIPGNLKADILRLNQWPRPVAGAKCASVATIVVDLSVSEDELHSKLKSHTRWKIRRAQKDGLTYEFSSDGDPKAARLFADHLDRCTDLKDLNRTSRARIAILSRQKLFDVSFVRDGAGEILCASSYLLTPSRTRGLWAGAIYRSTTDPTRRTIIGRANRLMYWRDMLRFKASGISAFDFGGYYLGSEDAEKLRINAFKEEFGGRVIQEFNCERALSLKGRAALWAIHRRGEWAMRRRAHLEGAAVEERESPISASV
jgi:hypothetical protein